MRYAIPAARRPSRRGFTFLEIAVCAALLAALLALVGKAIVAVELGMRRVDERAEAMRTIENLLEQFLSEPWEAIDDRNLRALSLPAALSERWPRAKLVGSVTDVEDPVPGKRVTLSLDPGQRSHERPVAVTTWIYQAPGGEQ
jgi:prepilin-type N-terminal cleavage/methylation domain-containing protein